jgi:hypothetical protein
MVEKRVGSSAEQLEKARKLIEEGIADFGTAEEGLGVRRRSFPNLSGHRRTQSGLRNRGSSVLMWHGF